MLNILHLFAVVILNFTVMANRPIYHKNCIICGKEFTAKRLHARYCSAKCRAIRSDQKKLKRVERDKRTSVFGKIDVIADRPHRSNVLPGGEVYIPEDIIKHILRTNHPPSTFSTGKHSFKKRSFGQNVIYVLDD